MSSDLELTSAQDGNPLTNEDPHRIAQYQENLNPQQPWMTVHALPNPEQPEPGRLVMHAVTGFGRPSYLYYDDLPRLYQRILVATVVLGVIATPLSLCCFIPALGHLKKVSMHINYAAMDHAWCHCMLRLLSD